jgi:hypothetical protein
VFMSNVLHFPVPALEVRNADPLNPPKPPPGARIVEIRDPTTQAVVGCSWIAPIFDMEAFDERAWVYAQFLHSIILRPAREA